MTKWIASILIVAAATSSCGKSKDKGGSGAPARALDPAPANAAVPAAWKAKLEFAAVKIEGDFKDDDPITAIEPKDWVAGKGIKSMREPPETKKDFGFGTHVWAGKGCNGECKSKSAAEWETAANKSFFDNELAHDPKPKVIKDVKEPGHRLMVAADQYTGGQVNNIAIMSAWWSDGGERFYFCTVDLAPEAKDLEPAFEQACSQKPAD